MNRINRQSNLIKTTSTAIFLLIATNFIALANGGPVDYSLFKKTGNIRLLQKADISLIKEDLKIKIIHDTTFIEVTYLLKNNGKAQTVYYGFPIDFYDKDHFDLQGVVVNGYKRINYFKAFVNGKVRKHSYWKQEDAYRANLKQKYFFTKDVPIHRYWYQLNLDFADTSTLELVIKYSVENRKEDGFGGRSFLPNASDRNFVYDLFPSSKWSDGVVQDFSISLDLSQLKCNDYKYNISGLEKLQIDKDSLGIYSLTFKNFDLKTRSFIGVRYSNYDFVKAYYVQEKFSPLQPVSIASSAPNAEYLIDGKPESVWKGKEGDWILIRFPVSSYKSRVDSTINISINPLGMLMLNGDYSSREQFLSSPKVRTIQLKANDYLIGSSHYNKVKKKVDFNYYINLDKPKWYFSDKNLLRVAHSPLKEILSDAINYSNKKPHNITLFGKTHIETIAIYITKSDSESKEVVISELYFFKMKYLW